MFGKKLAARFGAVAATTALGVAVSAGSASAYYNTPYIGYGYVEYGKGVWCVQHILNHNVVFNAGLTEDSYWGPKTEAAVENFQARIRASNYPGMQVDGIVGRDTGDYLTLYNNDGWSGYCENYLPDHL